MSLKKFSLCQGSCRYSGTFCLLGDLKMVLQNLFWIKDYRIDIEFFVIFSLFLFLFILSHLNDFLQAVFARQSLTIG